MKRNDQRIYQDHAATWWDDSQRPQRHLRSLIFPRLTYLDRIVPDWQGVKVLDLGCGGGFMSEALARRGARVVGVDPCRELVEAARRHARLARYGIDYVVGAGEAIPLRDASVDRVVCVDVLEHVEDVRKALLECRRVLRRGGLFFFDTINRNLLSRFAAVTLAENVLHVIMPGTHDPKRFIRVEEMRSHLEKSKFRLDSGFVGLGPVGINRRLDIIIGLFPSTLLAYAGHAVAI